VKAKEMLIEYYRASALVENYERKQRRRILQGRRHYFHFKKTRLAAKLEGRVEACEEILALLEREI
jgi:hypothetical protein